MLTLYPTGSGAKDAIWLDLLDPSAAETANARAASGLTVPTLAEISEIESSSRLNASGDAIYLSTPAITLDATGTPEMTAIGLVLSPHHLLTIRFAQLRAFRTAAEHLPATGGSANAFVCLLEAMADKLADVLEQVGARLDAISRGVFRAGPRRRRRTIDAELQRTLGTVGQAGDHIANIDEVLLGIERIVPYVREMAKAWLPEELDSRLETVRRDIHSLRDYNTHLENKAQFLLDATLGFINIEQNNIFRILTVVSIVGIPPTLVAGIYGMNFKHMPELSWAWGYEYGWAVIIASALIPLLLFRWRRWI